MSNIYHKFRIDFRLPPDQRPIKIYWTMALSAVLLPSLFVFLYLLSRDDVIWP